MRVLVVDDEASKRRQVVDFLNTLEKIKVIEEASSYQSALEKLRDQPFDWVVLDMRLTTYDLTAADAGGRPRKFGGEEVLRKITRRGIGVKVVVLTQYSLFRDGGSILTFNDLEKRLREKYKSFEGLISFQHSNKDWQNKLSNFLVPETT